MTPHVPTSSRLRGLYMSTMLRVKSSALAPSLTRMASGLALTMSRTTLSALWKFIGVGFFASDLGHLRDVLRLALRDGVEPLGGRLRPARSPMPASMRRDAGADVADDRRFDADVAVRLLRRDVDLDELLAAPCLGRSAAPRLALALRKQPVETRADQHDDVGFRQHVRARRGGGLLVRVGQQALGHRHRQVGDAGLFHQRANVRIGLRVRRALAEDDERTLRALEQVERALDRVRRRDLARRRIDDLDQRVLARFRVDRLRKQLGRQVEIDAAGTARDARRESRAPRRRRCPRRAARGTRPWREAWRWRAGPSPRSRPAAGRRSRARSSR